MFISKNRKRIVADEEIDVNVDAPVEDVDVDIEEDEITVDEAATELLFETEDVAELVAEIAGEPVDVTVEDDGTVTFAVGEDEFTVSPEGDEELLEASTKVLGKKAIKASTKGTARRAVKASTAARRAARRAIRK
jgi:hypothetical protein